MTAIVVVIILGGFVAALIFGGRAPSPFNERTCQGKGWRSAFPGVPKNEIRDFLSIFSSAFAFKDTEKLKFSPHDRILEIYRSIYSSRWMPDAMELETLDRDVEKTYHVSFAPIWNEELTLGELFSYVRTATRK